MNADKELKAEEQFDTSGEIYLGKAFLHTKSGKVFVGTDTPDEEHNCDEMGCATVGPHIVQWLEPARASRAQQVGEEIILAKHKLGEELSALTSKMMAKQIEGVWDAFWRLSSLLKLSRPLPVEGVRERPKIVCLCGSSKFTAHMAVIRWEFEKQGIITFALNYMPPEYGKEKGYPETYDHLAELEGCAVQQDELHKRKIDLSDEILVVNVESYIGSSTRSEIEYAVAHKKPVRFLEEDKKPDWFLSLLSDKT